MNANDEHNKELIIKMNAIIASLFIVFLIAASFLVGRRILVEPGVNVLCIERDAKYVCFEVDDKTVEDIAKAGLSRR